MPKAPTRASRRSSRPSTVAASSAVRPSRVSGAGSVAALPALVVPTTAHLPASLPTPSAPSLVGSAAGLSLSQLLLVIRDQVRTAVAAAIPATSHSGGSGPVVSSVVAAGSLADGGQIPVESSTATSFMHGSLATPLLPVASPTG